MAIALVSGQVADAGDSGSLASISVSFPAAVGAAHLVTAGVECNNAQTVSNVTMTGETFTQGVTFNGTSLSARMDGWYAFNTVGGQTQVTATFSAASTFVDIEIAEFSGAMTAADPKDKTATGDDAGTSSAAITTPDQTPSVNGELIWGYARSQSTAPTANSPFTLLVNNSNLAFGTEYQIQATAAAVHADFSLTGAANWDVIMMTFKPPAAGGRVLRRITMDGNMNPSLDGGAWH